MKRDGSVLLSNLNQLLRAPAAVAERCREEHDLRPLVLASFAALLAGGVLFGATLGSNRGALQALYAGLKLPLAMLAALVVCVPAFHVLCAGIGRPQPFRAVIALTLASAGRAGLVLLACAPALWLGMDTILGYHAAIVAATLCYGLAGAVALGVALRGLGGDARGVVTALAFTAVLLPVGGQTAWMLRPFLGRPAQLDVPFARAPESSFAEAAVRSTLSAAGIFTREPSWRRDLDQEYP